HIVSGGDSHDWEFVKQAVEVNGPALLHLAVFMLDQMFPEVAGVEIIEALSSKSVEYISNTIEVLTRAKVDLVGTGPYSVVWRSYRPGLVDTAKMNHPAGYGTRYDKPRLVGQTGPEFVKLPSKDELDAKERAYYTSPASRV